MKVEMNGRTTSRSVAAAAAARNSAPEAADRALGAAELHQIAAAGGRAALSGNPTED
jgi:hypothetical protein